MLTVQRKVAKFSIAGGWGRALSPLVHGIRCHCGTLRTPEQHQCGGTSRPAGGAPSGNITVGGCGDRQETCSDGGSGWPFFPAVPLTEEDQSKNELKAWVMWSQAGLVLVPL